MRVQSSEEAAQSAHMSATSVTQEVPAGTSSRNRAKAAGSQAVDALVVGHTRPPNRPSVWGAATGVRERRCIRRGGGGGNKRTLSGSPTVYAVAVLARASGAKEEDE